MAGALRADQLLVSSDSSGLIERLLREELDECDCVQEQQAARLSCSGRNDYPGCARRRRAGSLITRQITGSGTPVCSRMRATARVGEAKRLGFWRVRIGDRSARMIGRAAKEHVVFPRPHLNFLFRIIHALYHATNFGDPFHSLAHK